MVRKESLLKRLTVSVRASVIINDGQAAVNEMDQLASNLSQGVNHLCECTADHRQSESTAETQRRHPSSRERMAALKKMKLPNNRKDVYNETGDKWLWLEEIKPLNNGRYASNKIKSRSQWLGKIKLLIRNKSIESALQWLGKMKWLNNRKGVNNERERERTLVARQNETDEQREKRLQQNRERSALARQNETTEQREKH